MPPPPPGSTPRPLPPVLPPRRYNRLGLYLAVAIVAACIPFTLHFQRSRAPNLANRQWQMLNLQSITNTAAAKRYGQPARVRDFSLSEGIFAGPKVGLKHFYRVNTPEYAAHKDDPVVWSFPEYSRIREMVWQLPDSTLTLWLHEPRALIDLTGDVSDVYLPGTSPDEWVAVDNYRIGNDLLKPAPASK